MSSGCLMQTECVSCEYLQTPCGKMYVLDIHSSEPKRGILQYKPEKSTPLVREHFQYVRVLAPRIRGAANKKTSAVACKRYKFRRRLATEVKISEHAVRGE